MKNFKHNEINLYNMDCMDFMKDKSDNYYDLAIVDLEYNIGASKPSKKPEFVKQKNGSLLKVKNTNSYKHKEWDFKKSSPEYFEELFRVSKKQIIFGGNYYGLEGGYLVWDKMNGNSDQFGCELAWLSFSKRTDIVRFMWSGMIQGVTPSKEIHIANKQQGNKKLNENRIHPTQKPVKLYKWILKNYAEEKHKILDTHLGSGSIAIACNDLGFYLDGIELDAEYFELMHKRLANAFAQTSLF